MGQGASGGAGQGAGNNRFVKFTRPAAQRIAAVVRHVEGGNRDQLPFAFEHPQGIAANAKVFRVCTYTGSWSKGSAKVVTFKYTTSTPNTASATNLFFPVAGTAGGDCAIAKDGTAWFLIDVPMFTATAVFVGSTTSGISISSTATSSRVTDISLSASLNTSNCTISIGKTLTTASSIFVTGTATGIFVSTTYTATFVKFEA
jgi:hypothetical protein